MTLPNRDMALLAAKLQAPAVIARVLDGDTELTGDLEYGLHEMISEFEPDTALLAIAAGAQVILARYKSPTPGTRVLGFECERILADYGSLWLENAQGAAPDPERLFNVLTGTAEDLEGLAEMLEGQAGFLEDDDPDAAALCEVLLVQARAHSLVAEAFMEEADSFAREMAQMAEKARPRPALVIANTGNVIAFPLQQKPV